jgi:predicted PurR-regulated permease PerM
MPNERTPEPRRHPVYAYVILGAALFAFIQSYSLLSPILLSFILIVLISLAINPVVSKLRSWTGGRTGATLLVVVALFGLVGVTGWLFVGPMKNSLTNFVSELPDYWQRVQKPLIKAERQAELVEERIKEEVTVELEAAAAADGKPDRVRRPVEPAPAPPSSEGGTIRSGLSEMIRGLAGSFMKVAFNATQLVIVLVTVFFGVTFTLMNPRPIFGAMFALVPERHHERALDIMQCISTFVPRWAGATLLAMLTIGTLVFLLTWPIFGLSDALVLGLTAGVLEAVPFLGPILSVVPAVLLAIGKGGMTPLWVLIIYAGVQALENNVILPLIMARGMKLHPVAVIFSMLICVVAFGVLGVLIAPPMVAILTILHEQLYRKTALPTVTDGDLDRLARRVLREKPVPKPPAAS